jgi:hypothetical protein
MRQKNIKLFSYNKYKNKSCKCLQNHIHDSRGEARYCDQLKLEKNQKIIQDYEVQKNISLDVNGYHICNHRVDFLILDKDDNYEVREFKGFETDVWNIKYKLFEALFPDIKYIIIKG